MIHFATALTFGYIISIRIFIDYKVFDLCQKWLTQPVYIFNRLLSTFLNIIRNLNAAFSESFQR